MVRNANQLFVNIGAGNFTAEWAEITENASEASEANPGDFLLLDVNNTGDDPWTWIEGGAPPSSDGLWVEAGGQLTPATQSNNVVIGDSKITLTAASGSATFAGNISVGGLYDATADHSQTTINPNGTFITVPSTATAASTALVVKKSSDDGTAASDVVALYADGSATFASTVKSGDSTFAALNPGYVVCQNAAADINTTYFRGRKNSSDYQFEVRGDGTTYIGGTLTGVVETSSPKHQLKS